MKVALLLISGVLLAWKPPLAVAIPCSQNFGGCDRANGMCWSTGRFTSFCTCKGGFVDSGLPFHRCDDVDECEDNTICPENAKCDNTYGSYICTCNCGYVKDYTGQYCLDPYQITDRCEVPRKCINDAGKVKSFNKTRRNFVTYRPENRVKRVRSKQLAFGWNDKCEPGFTFNKCGYCIDIDECGQNKNLCTGLNIECINTEGSYYCDCAAGYILGPCRKQCYRQEDFGSIPEICEDEEQEFEGLASRAVPIRQNWLQPITLENFESCAAGVAVGKTTVQRFDVDHNGDTDILLTWFCGTRRSSLKAVGTGEARWDKWTRWTECKATCWGGLQTRTRECLNGVPGLGGCAGHGSEKRSCYTGPKCEFRFRRDVETLTDAQKDDLVQAMEKYKADTSSRGFFNAAAAHGWPGQCNGRSCCPHGARMTFLAWHRSIILNYELGLNSYLIDKTLGVPYWNWLRINNEPPSFVVDATYKGKPNPFASMRVRIDLDSSSPRDIERSSPFGPQNKNILDNAKEGWNNVVLQHILTHTMLEFSEALEAAHGAPHVAMCPGCRISMASLQFAGFDPIFMFHHGQIDRLWALAQKKMEDNGTTCWTTQTALEPTQTDDYWGRKHDPFNNKTLNYFPMMQAVTTMRDSYYYEELTGVKYDFLGRDGMPELDELVRRRLPARPIVDGAFIAHYIQSVDINVFVNYYRDAGTTPCSRLTGRNYLSSTTIQATPNKFRNTIPRLLSILSTLRYREASIKACYTTQPDCVERCPEATSKRIDNMPDPFLVHYVQGHPIDEYKIEWSSGRRMPRWWVSLHAGGNWIKFYGNRVSNIVQVRTWKEWKDCDSSNGRPIDCSDKPCLLLSGVYRFIDSDDTHCQNGLQLKIASRH